MSSFTLVNETCVIPNLLVNKLYWFPLISIMDKKTIYIYIYINTILICYINKTILTLEFKKLVYNQSDIVLFSFSRLYTLSVFVIDCHM